jgi:hypothetical protein
MKTVQVRERSGADGVLRLHIPVGAAEAECEVMVVVHPQALGWPAGYLDRVLGSITDPTFERPPQGNYENRLGIE